MVHFSEFRFTEPIDSACDTHLAVRGLLHSVTPGSRNMCFSPGIFAACHDLLRRAAPRHPP